MMTTYRFSQACRLLDRAITDYRHAVADTQRPNGKLTLYTSEERWDMVIAARRLLEEPRASP